MKTLLKFLLVSLLSVGAAYAADPPGNPIPKDLEPLNEASDFCPDGGIITARLYDVNPADPEAPLYVSWSRGNLLVAVLHQQAQTLYIEALHQTLPLDEVRGRWATPCDLPFPVGQGT